LDPENFAAHYALGRIYMELNEVPKAVAILEKAAKIAPNVASVYFVLSRAYARANRPTDAARARAEFARLEKLDEQKRSGPRSSAN
jgi:cytochrome c-type biogenesis protein CcmH/NrfG